MADIREQVLIAATSFDLVTLEEAKLMTGMSVTDSSDDAQIKLFINIASASIAARCNNRVFAKEKVRETWRDVGDRRIFLRHWPVIQADIESVESPAGTVLDPASYELDERSGKLSNFNGGWTEPIVVTYTGGYDLPGGAPDALKNAAGILILQEKTRAMTAAVAGIRMLSHKDSRVVYHDPSKIFQAAMGAANTPVEQALMALLSHFMHFQV
jgi:hypothetical protein